MAIVASIARRDKCEPSGRQDTPGRGIRDTRHRTRMCAPRGDLAGSIQKRSEYDELPWWVNKTSIGLLMFAKTTILLSISFIFLVLVLVLFLVFHSTSNFVSSQLATRASKWRPKQMAAFSDIKLTTWLFVRKSHACA
ncbi:hypothetical protein ACLKA7_008416 [Drosophila subpalustris]